MIPDEEMKEWLDRAELTPVQTQQFRNLLKKRNVKLCMLATQCKADPAHLSLVISGKRRGKNTYKWLREFLSYEELQVLRGTTSCKSNKPSESQ